MSSSAKTEVQTVRDHLDLLEQMIKCGESSPQVIRNSRAKVTVALKRLEAAEHGWDLYTNLQENVEGQLDRVVRTQSRRGTECALLERLRTVVDVLLAGGAKNLYCKEFSPEEMKGGSR